MSSKKTRTFRDLSVASSEIPAKSSVLGFSEDELSWSSIYRYILVYTDIYSNLNWVGLTSLQNTFLHQDLRDRKKRVQQCATCIQLSLTLQLQEQIAVPETLSNLVRLAQHENQRIALLSLRLLPGSRNIGDPDVLAILVHELLQRDLIDGRSAFDRCSRFAW